MSKRDARHELDCCYSPPNIYTRRCHLADTDTADIGEQRKQTVSSDLLCSRCVAAKSRQAYQCNVSGQVVSSDATATATAAVAVTVTATGSSRAGLASVAPARIAAAARD